jgi:DnaJ-class molecular chaperone
LAKKYHPDNNPKDDRSLHKYLLVTQAYSVLGDLDRRLDYAIKLSDEQWQNYKLTEQEKREIRNIVNRK